MTERGEALDLVLRRSIAFRRAETELIEAMRAARDKGATLRDVADYTHLSHEGVRKMTERGKGK
jgi:orotate phosphoribosyltransferase-like protein